MHVVIIGGTGHVGTHLVPRLVEAGYTVTSVTRGNRGPYQPHAAWDAVTQVNIDRDQAERDGTFGQQIRDLAPDIVIDMICFTPESSRHLVEALRGRVSHFLHCGTIWIHGHTAEVPTTEAAARQPICDYGTKKSIIERELMQEARLNGFPATAVHPGHITGPGYEPVTPQGNRDLSVFETLARGETLRLPNIGMETVHHVHADDVAQVFMQALANRSTAIGESFHAVSPGAITLRGYAEIAARWFGQEAKLEFLPWDTWKATVSAEIAEATWDHIAHSPHASIDKARRLLGYAPRYTSLQAIKESVDWLIANGEIDV